MLYANFLLDLRFSPKKEGDTLLRNIDGISADFAALSEDKSLQSYISSHE
jgi:hypothetical protein